MSGTYTKILVGVDGSEYGAKALQEAVRIAQTFKAELHVFHAIRHHFYFPIYPLNINGLYPGTPAIIPYTEEQMREIYQESGRQIIEQAKQQVTDAMFPLDLKVFYSLETNISPDEYAISFAGANNIDLIVVGCAGHHSRARMTLTGTVTTNIINKAPCQVLVVR